MDISDAKQLIAPCGIDCGGCGMYRGRIIARVADNLKELIDAHGHAEWVPEFGGIDFDYAEFQKGLAYYTKENSGCFCQVPCSKGGGMPGCAIRECAQKKEIDICFDCGEFPCGHFSRFLEHHPFITEEAKRYRELGAEEWIFAQVSKAEKGYCRATGKYYERPTSES
jgi:hypothetical protein